MYQLQQQAAFSAAGLEAGSPDHASSSGGAYTVHQSQISRFHQAETSFPLAQMGIHAERSIHAEMCTRPAMGMGSDRRISHSHLAASLRVIARLMCSMSEAPALALALGAGQPAHASATVHHWLSGHGPAAEASLGAWSQDGQQWVAAAADIPPMEDPAHGFIDGFHIAMFFLVLAFGVLFLAAMLCINADINMQNASLTIIHRLSKTVALRQVGIILAVMLLVRKGLEPVIIILRKVFKRDNKPWDSCIEAALLRETYRPLEALFVIAALTSLAENFLPQLIAVPRAVVVNVVRSTLSLSFILACANIVFNIKARVLREWTWELELKGELTRQRRMEALDKLMSVMTLLVGAVMSCQAVGLDVNSVLAIGGVGGLAIGLAGREILENLFTGLIILSSSPFEVGEEVMFTPSTGPKVEGIVLDVGWYRTNIRSFEREIYVIPNSVFSRNVVLNVTRKEKEWRIFEFIGIQVDDFQKLNAVISDMRKVLRQDNRIIQRLHRRVFLDKITTEQVLIYVSVYVEATNRDAFMAVKQDLLMAFVDCCDRNGARLARKRTQVELVMEPDAQSLRLPPSLTSGGPVTTTQDGGPSPTSTRSDFTKLRSYTDLDEERGMPVEALPYQGGHLPPHQAWQQTDFSKPQPPMSEQEFQARSQAQQSQQEQDRIEFERQRALADQQWRERNKKVAADVINKVATSINTAFRLDPPGQGPIGDGNGRQNPYLTASYDEL
eukprot:CAMPEP_0206139714 /NCGR_PEP_ID=MMETSP1473-20131121/7027_1 /ASSEMBLY_ACC=CAM_ASM_001109 /TAXON_ID=1461547 /ORGANISM="Stichococcus sp, Strain RCC1054" /LENGTH=726 /DNA_ID=CAMNT_0053533603 /DNA_START=266 /DNA_END=2449 /DNA_ORIENTATION=-